MKYVLACAMLVLASGCASKAGNTACVGITDTLASPCIAAANICQGVLHLPCLAVPVPGPTP